MSLQENTKIHVSMQRKFYSDGQDVFIVEVKWDILRIGPTCPDLSGLRERLEHRYGIVDPIASKEEYVYV